MVRSELVRKVSAAHPHLSPATIRDAVDAILAEIMASLGRGDRVQLRGFGSFFTSHRQGRLGWNLRKRIWMPVPANDVLRFRASQQLLERLNVDDRRRAPERS